MSKNKKKFGDIGEDIACKYLTEKGFSIIDRNYFYGHGEIDIIAKISNELVFVEVKTRKSIEYGYPETSITKNKIKQIKKTAEAYLYENNIKDQICRFDFIGILMLDNNEPVITHIKNAF
ncbi:YraN family protein [Melioribacteraceae bacterium 4301-Me]|uniref:YraN family protein n=1 Tax=Pyranulibacter aquaticus TaxID=3163344 RepID=UPI003596FD29